MLVRTPARGWEFPGGVIEPGETLAQGLEREVLEESGLIVKTQKLLAWTQNISTLPPKLIFVFSAEWLSGSLQPSAETPELGWFRAEQAEDMIQHPANALRWRLAQQAAAGLMGCVYRQDPFELLESSVF